MIDYCCPHGEVRLCMLCTDRVGYICYEKLAYAPRQQFQEELKENLEPSLTEGVSPGPNWGCTPEGYLASGDEYAFTCGPTDEEALCDLEEMFSEADKRELVTHYLAIPDNALREFGRTSYYEDPAGTRWEALQDGLFEQLRIKLLNALDSTSPDFFMLFVDSECPGRSWAREFLEADEQLIRTAAWRSALEVSFDDRGR